jgi:hypothetical protein
MQPFPNPLSKIVIRREGVSRQEWLRADEKAAQTNSRRLKMKNLLTVFALAAVTAVVVSKPAAAQAPPMNMSWAFTTQNALQVRNDAFARTMAMRYYNYMQQLRAAGYTGPSLPTGFNAQTLMQSGRALNAATQAYIQGSTVNRNITSNAVGDYDMRAIRGCTKLYSGPQGAGYYGCPSN